MMQLTLPKAIRGQRSFLSEIAIVVIGVLLALGAQSLVEQQRWRGEIQIANDAFKDEFASASLVAYERVAVQPCLQSRINELSRTLAGSNGPWKAAPLAISSDKYFNVMPAVYRAPLRQLPTDGWKNALANGTLNHLPANRVRELSSLYDMIARFNDLSRDEAQAAAVLAPLAYDREIDSENRNLLLGSLAEVDRINALMALDANQLIESVRALRMDFSKSEVEEGRSARVKTQRDLRGGCVLSPPLNLH